MFGNLNNVSVDDFFKYLGYVAFFLFIIYIITCILRVKNNFLLDSFGVNSIKEGFSEDDQEKLKDYSEKIDLVLDKIEKENEHNIKRFSKLPDEVKQTLGDFDKIFSEWAMYTSLQDLIQTIDSSSNKPEKKVDIIINKLSSLKKSAPDIYKNMQKFLNDETLEKSSKKSSLW